jgi:two-component system sensor histidine kinase UhpB
MSVPTTPTRTLLLSALDAYLAQTASLYARELEEQVAARTAALARANQRLLEVEEVERQHLAGELHDRVGQDLTALGLNLQFINSRLQHGDQKDLEPRLEDCIALVESAASSVENVLTELHPAMLEEHGILAALRDYAQDFAARTGAAVTIVGEAPRRLSKESALGLFRIAQEALTNIAKHARATGVRIELTEEADGLTLRISDDGAGFQTPASGDRPARAGRGVRLMRDRAQSLGGRLEVHSSAGQGTQITVWLPY